MAFRHRCTCRCRRSLYSDVYFDKKHSSPATARHCKNNIDVEDTICQRWKEYVNFGMWVTFNESRVAGWYNSAMTIGPEPKPIWTGATIHSLCVSKGDLAGYKLHARTYGGASEESLCVKHKHKFVTLLDTFLDAFQGKGHCVTWTPRTWGILWARLVERSGRLTWSGRPKRIARELLRRRTYKS